MASINGLVQPAERTDDGARQEASPYSLEVRELTKRFGAQIADDSVSLGFRTGEVHALLGENGAGKTTLMNMCFGLIAPDGGQILVNGQPVTMRSPLTARRLGLGMVHQHFKLVPSLTVSENVFLGAELTGLLSTLNRRQMAADVNRIAERFGLELNAAATVADLSAGAQQRVEILKALYFDARVLILDEPTAVLTPQETVGLFGVMRELAGSGRTVIIITHKLREVLEVSDRYSVMRRGRLVATGDTAKATERGITVQMVGREVDLDRTQPPRVAGSDSRVALACEGLSVVVDGSRRTLDDVSLKLYAGEILGIAGVEGNGQTELIEALAGIRAVSAGRVLLDGNDITNDDPAARRSAGVAHVPEDRLATGVSLESSVAENLVGGFFDSNLFPRGLYRKSDAERWSAATIDRQDIRGATPRKPIGQLSGGNMQRVVVAREVGSNPAVMLASQPTRGVDVGATQSIHDQLRDLRERGAAVLLVSADLGELLALSDRLLVMYRGAVVGEFRPDPADVAEIGLAMAGAVGGRASDVLVSDEQLQDSVVEATVIDPDKTLAEPIPLVRNIPRPDRTRVLEAPRDESRSVRSGGRVRAWGAQQPERLKAARAGATQPVIAVFTALVIGYIIIWSLGDNPVGSYNDFILGSFQGSANFSNLIAQTEPLLLVAVSVWISFRGGVFNIGAEGQMYVGSLLGAIAASSLPHAPGIFLMIVAALAGAVAGALWSLIPALLYAIYDVNVVVVTLMFNYLATYLTAYLVNGPLRDPTAGQPSTKLIPPQANLPRFFTTGQGNAGIFVGLLALVIAALAIAYTRWGLKVRFVGGSVRFAKYLGISVRAKIIQVMLISGAIAGLAGVVETLGVQYRFNQNFSPGYGFLGVTVVLLGRLRPLGILIAAIVYAALETGGAFMQFDTGTPVALVQLIQGIIVVLMTASTLRLIRPGRGSFRRERNGPRRDVAAPTGQMVS
jgi:ABC-type uncharacterized transport system ATPase subunit/ABC-type uncharacterized transport system permease subunit